VGDLSENQVVQYQRDGYLAPLDLLSPAETAELRRAILDHLGGRFGTGLYELTDPVEIKRVGPVADPRYAFVPGNDDTVALTAFPFLFNMWKTDARFLELGTREIFAAIARQLLVADEVLLMEDNVVVKLPHSKYLPWHQDYSYWPVGEPRALTFWIAIDDVGPENGAMEVAPGTQKLGERLPVAFGSEQAFMREARPDLPDVPADPAALGHETITYRLRAGQGGVHHALVWHGSTANAGEVPRHALALRYVAEGTLWLGDRRIPYDEIDVAPGGRLTRDTFPLAGARRDLSRHPVGRTGRSI
jgi:phytanoyl-CoA hydroxylase